MKKYAIARILQNNQDYLRSQEVRALLRRSYLLRWRNSMLLKQQTDARLFTVVSLKAEKVLRQLFSELKEQTLLSKIKKAKLQRARNFYVFALKRRNLKKLRLSA